MNINRRAIIKARFVIGMSFQYQLLIKVFLSVFLQIFFRKAAVMAAIITLSVFPINVFADKDTRVTERSADQVSTLR